MFAASCARLLPWRGQTAGSEVNLAFTLERNLIELQTVRLNDRPGRFLLGTAAPRTVLDPAYAGAAPHVLQISDKRGVDIVPATLDPGGVADGILGADAWENGAIVIDYRSGLATYQTTRVEPAYMTVFRYSTAPTVDVNVNGTRVTAIV
ncbi:MAG TPA: hypothetical protein VF911_02040, partial [Thermoanaerobaculia bacterium]